MAADCLYWWAGLLVLGLGFVPVVERIVSSAEVGRASVFAKPLALVSLCYLAWLLTSAGIPHGSALALSGLVLGAVSIAAWVTRPRGRWLASWLGGEALFLAVLVAFALIRALQPDIFGAEKYMDYAFFNTLIRAERFPPQDPWMSGVTLNYYYFGHLLFADLARLTGAAPAVAYNLALATVGAIVATGAASIGRQLVGHPLGGAMAALATVGIGNLDGARQLLHEGRTIDTFDTWSPTRIVPHTINEFPFFSLLHGDLHPHVTALVINVTLIGVALATVRTALTQPPAGDRSVLPGLAAIALLLGVLALTNPWDIPVSLTLLGLLAVACLWEDDRPLRAVLRVGGLMTAAVIALLVLALPFALSFRAQGQGIGQVHARTAIVPFLLVFGALAVPAMIRLFHESREDLPEDPRLRDLLLAVTALAAIALYLASQSLVLVATTCSALAGVSLLLGGRRSEPDLAVALATTGFVAIAAGDLVFLRDPYGEELHRMNTIFKLYFEAWMLLALALPAMVRSFVGRIRSPWQALAIGTVAVAVGASLCYPAAAIAQRYRQTRGPSLDGTAYLVRDHADDAGAIRWLADEVHGLPVVLEATGDPYSYFARVSSNTGLPTLLGWANHEGVWRGADARIAQRARDVGRLYTENDLSVVRSLLGRYRVRYVFIGELERQRFDATALAKFSAHPELFVSVYRGGTTEVFAVRETSDSE